MNEKLTLFLVWQDSESRKWYPIGRLERHNGDYVYSYIRGARLAIEEADFRPFDSFPKLEDHYLSTDLFPLFSNRVPPKSRPEYKDYLEWLAIAKNEDEPMALLMRSGGRRNTDAFEVIPVPEQDEQGNYIVYFFPHGLRYMETSALERIKTLNSGEHLSLVHDCDNPVDPDAIALMTEDGYKVGYCPRYLLADVWASHTDWHTGNMPVKVVRINLGDAPLQYRLLCKLTSKIEPYHSEQFLPISQEVVSG